MLADGEDLGVVLISSDLRYQRLDVCLGQHDRVREHGKFVNGQVLLVHQLSPGDGRHLGEELVPRAVAAAVLHWLQVADRGEKLGGPLVLKGREGVQLLTPLVVREVCLLHPQLLEDGVWLGLCHQVPRDASNH